MSTSIFSVVHKQSCSAGELLAVQTKSWGPCRQPPACALSRTHPGRLHRAFIPQGQSCSGPVLLLAAEDKARLLRRQTLLELEMEFFFF